MREILIHRYVEGATYGPSNWALWLQVKYKFQSDNVRIPSSNQQRGHVEEEILRGRKKPGGRIVAQPI